MRRMIRALYRGWLAAGKAIGWLVSRVVLCALFFLLIFPVSLIMRALRFDPLQRRFRRDVQTYWKTVPREPFERRRCERMY